MLPARCPSRVATARSEQPRSAARLAKECRRMSRRARLDEAGAHFGNSHAPTLGRPPPVDDAACAEGWPYEGTKGVGAATGRKALRTFIGRTDRVLGQIEAFVPEARRLDDGETLTFPHSTISTRRHLVRVHGDGRARRRLRHFPRGGSGAARWPSAAHEGDLGRVHVCGAGRAAAAAAGPAAGLRSRGRDATGRGEPRSCADDIVGTASRMPPGAGSRAACPTASRARAHRQAAWAG